MGKGGLAGAPFSPAPPVSSATRALIRATRDSIATKTAFGRILADLSPAILLRLRTLRLFHGCLGLSVINRIRSLHWRFKGAVITILPLRINPAGHTTLVKEARQETLDLAHSLVPAVPQRLGWQSPTEVGLGRRRQTLVVCFSGSCWGRCGGSFCGRFLRHLLAEGRMILKVVRAWDWLPFNLALFSLWKIDASLLTHGTRWLCLFNLRRRCVVDFALILCIIVLDRDGWRRRRHTGGDLCSEDWGATLLDLSPGRLIEDVLKRSSGPRPRPANEEPRY
ncbi:hypothetical protein KC349_g66 [Hortaea werneckii]|nr:hypothetical protein KC349_g66 [Hortaea werneckii]